MVHLPGSGKRRAEPAPAVKVEEEGLGGGDGPPHKRVKEVTPSPPPPPQVDWPLPPFIIRVSSPLASRIPFRLSRQAILPSNLGLVGGM
jgi:hypothetical protein